MDKRKELNLYIDALDYAIEYALNSAGKNGWERGSVKIYTKIIDGYVSFETSKRRLKEDGLKKLHGIEFFEPLDYMDSKEVERVTWISYDMSDSEYESLLNDIRIKELDIMITHVKYIGFLRESLIKKITKQYKDYAVKIG